MPIELFDIEIKIPNGVSFKKIGLEKQKDIEEFDFFIEKNGDEKLKEIAENVKQHFGFMSTSNAGYSVSVSGYMPRIKEGEKHTCPQRANSLGSMIDSEAENIDIWETRGDDKCCSFCGSLHPDRLLELITEHGFNIIEASTKSYKLYVNRKSVPNASYGGIKYYMWHNTPEFIEKYNGLLSDYEKAFKR